ncbi:unnamed protein product [Larinioides sclopetarius]|uniref:Uncharacterized protein n=1 Tax=Larinioides sclopetarius TaxID=280406 RepID=A0AAV1YT35_9ARAC
MSSVSVSDITAMSFQFAVKWSIPVRELNNKSSSEKEIISHTLTSNRYRLNNIKTLDFTFSLTCGKDFIMKVKNWDDAPLFQDDALILIEDKIYRVKCNSTNTIGRLIFDRDVLTRNSFRDDKVTFHCIVSIFAKVIPMDQKYAPFRTAYSEKNKNQTDIIEFESLLLNYYDLDPHGYDAVNDFRYSSRIPNFNVKMALSMIDEAHKRHDPILKALCSEYLMENLTTENVSDVLKQSLKSNATDLSQRCADFLAEKCKITALESVV